MLCRVKLRAVLVFALIVQITDGQSPPPLICSVAASVPSSYSPNAAPPPPTAVNITLTLMGVYEIDHNLVSASWDVLMAWNDPRLSFPCGNAVLTADKVWTPDIFINNRKTQNEEDIFNSRYRVWINQNSVVSWKVYGDITSRCQQDMTLFPFDKHECSIEFSSQAYCSNSVNFTATNPLVQIHTQYPATALWKVETNGLEARYSENGCSPVLSFRLRFVRKPIVIVVVIAIPIIILLIMNVAIFCLPPSSSEKIGLSTSIFFIIALFFVYGSDVFPLFGSSVPLIIVYLIISIVFSALSLIASIFVIRLSYRRTDVEPPSWLLNIARCMGALLCIRHGNEVDSCCSRKKKRNDEEEIRAQQASNNDFKKVVFIAPNGTQIYPSGNTCTNDVTSTASANDIHTLAVVAKQEKQEHKLLAQWTYIATVADRVFFHLFAISEVVVVLVFLWWYPAIPSGGSYYSY